MEKLAERNDICQKAPNNSFQKAQPYQPRKENCPQVK
jgi:hypothetical protein